MIRQKQRLRIGLSYPPDGHSLPTYSASELDLETGPSFGNSAVWLETQANGAIERMFNLGIGKDVLRSVVLRYGGTGAILRGESGGRSRKSTVRYIGLNRDEPATVEINPAYWRRCFRLGGAVEVRETTFVPLRLEGRELPLAYTTVELRSIDGGSPELRTIVFARLRASGPADISARYDPELRALIATSKSDPSAVRIIGLDVEPTGHATTTDFGTVYERAHAHPLTNDTSATGDILGALQLDFHLHPDRPFRFSVIAGAFGEGEHAALEEFRTAPDAALALTRTEECLADFAHRAHVLTPDASINQGSIWSKVDMRRVMGSYPTGDGFTNEPGKSSNVIMRDAAWFVYGCDHFCPEFSRALLDTFSKKQYPNGKLPEYYNGLDGHVEDYGLNINDDTPLYVLAVNHHFRATGDAAWLRKTYPHVAKAARYIISQIDSRDLVYCSADDPRGNVWGIAGWRNIIDGYWINGAVTEINAECAAALRSAGHLAENIGRPPEEPEEFFGAARRVRAAMDEHLLNPDTGLYYLNIDTAGVTHTDVTGDQIFPVMFRVCDDETGYRIISRLNSPDFWTEAGLRTASRNDPLYHPSEQNGLLGGVWPGLTWWYAFAAARYHPEFMVRALRSSFAHYASSPKVNNTTPGQFSEWFDGESLINRGMRLSPWEPPRFLWAAVEGICGLMLTPASASVSPVVPNRWRWVGVRRLQYHGSEITYFAVREGESFRIYGTGDITAGPAFESFDEDVSDFVSVFSQAAVAIALRRNDRILVLVGNQSDATATVPLNIAKIVDHESSYRIRVYNSERNDWEMEFAREGHLLASLAIVVETLGFRLIDIRPD
jgi:hypothetical protein